MATAPCRPHTFYFSVTTISTLGYSDMLPASAITRSYAMAEVIMGQRYLAVLIARLVGMHIAHSRTET
jgi:hypothetical protein